METLNINGTIVSFENLAPGMKVSLLYYYGIINFYKAFEQFQNIYPGYTGIMYLNMIHNSSIIVDEYIKELKSIN